MSSKYEKIRENAKPLRDRLTEMCNPIAAGKSVNADWVLAKMVLQAVLAFDRCRELGRREQDDQRTPHEQRNG